MPGKGRDESSAETGRSGEELARNYLARQGCLVLARNWRANRGEVDIVADCPSISSPPERELAFVEVRTRHGRSGLAEESISPRKAASMAAAAYAYMTAHEMDPAATHWRIDLLAVAMSPEGPGAVNWIKGAVGEEALPGE